LKNSELRLVKALMLKDDVMKFLNLFFERTNLPIRITELLLYRPVIHEPPFEHLEVINEASRLASCDPLFIEIGLKHNSRWYEYQIRCRNEQGSFAPGIYLLKYCDIYPGEDPKKVEKDMEENIDRIGRLLLKTLEILSRH
jgi:hypothetical protein